MPPPPKRRRSRSSSIARVPVPVSLPAWLREIAAAYADAHDAIPSGPLAGAEITEAELFHLAPAATLKFRGITATPEVYARASEAALASYASAMRVEPARLADPHMAFAYCYVAAHFGLDLVTADQAVEALDHVASKKKPLAGQIEALIHPR